MLVDPFRLLKNDARKPRKKHLHLCAVLNPSTYMCWPQWLTVNAILGPDRLLELKNGSSDFNSTISI
jgi:hypothetical protein